MSNLASTGIDLSHQGESRSSRGAWDATPEYRLGDLADVSVTRPRVSGGVSTPAQQAHRPVEMFRPYVYDASRLSLRPVVTD